MSKEKSDPLGRSERRVVGQVPCRQCGKPADLTRWGEKTWAWVNARLALAKQRPLERSEVAECPDCIVRYHGQPRETVAQARPGKVLPFDTKSRASGERDPGEEG